MEAGEDLRQKKRLIPNDLNWTAVVGLEGWNSAVNVGTDRWSIEFPRELELSGQIVETRYPGLGVPNHLVGTPLDIGASKLWAARGKADGTLRYSTSAIWKTQVRRGSMGGVDLAGG